MSSQPNKEPAKHTESIIDSVHETVSEIDHSLWRSIDAPIRGVGVITGKAISMAIAIPASAASGMMLVGLLLYGLEFLSYFENFFMLLFGAILMIVGLLGSLIWILTIYRVLRIPVKACINFASGNRHAIKHQMIASIGTSKKPFFTELLHNILCARLSLKIIAITVPLEIVGVYIWGFLDPSYEFRWLFFV